MTYATMGGQHELRAAKVSTVDKDAHGFWADVVTFGPVDSYGTRWDPKVFDESLADHMPVLAWGHDWSEPIGRADDHTKTDTTQRVHFRLDDGDFVPRAKQALYQLGSGTVTDVSVGILRRADSMNDDDTVTITKADLDEVSLVLRGAVPGALVDLASVRSRTYIDLGSGQRAKAPALTLDAVLEMGKRVAAGELTIEAAHASIELMGGDVPALEEGHEEVTDPVEPDPAVVAAEAEADAATVYGRDW